jgi:hypothetical protein
MSVGIWWAWVWRHAEGVVEEGAEGEGIGRAAPGWVQ